MVCFRRVTKASGDDGQVLEDALVVYGPDGLLDAGIYNSEGTLERWDPPQCLLPAEPAPGMRWTATHQRGDRTSERAVELLRCADHPRVPGEPGRDPAGRRCDGAADALCGGCRLQRPRSAHPTDRPPERAQLDRVLERGAAHPMSTLGKSGPSTARRLSTLVLGLAFSAGCSDLEPKAADAKVPKVPKAQPEPAATTTLSGTGTMRWEGGSWVLVTEAGTKLCPPDGVFQDDDHKVIFEGERLQPKPNVRMSCAPFRYTKTAAASPVTKGAFTNVVGEVTELRIMLKPDPAGPAIEACQPHQLKLPVGSVVKASGHPMGDIAKSCELMVFTELVVQTPSPAAPQSPRP